MARKIQPIVKIRSGKGERGDPATATAGTTTTGVAGTNAAVVNSGTTTDAVFDFTIPRGNTGEKGDKGDKGDTGDTGSAGEVTSDAGTYTDSGFVYFDGTDGNKIKDSGLTFKDEDNMASDSATAIPSQQSVKAYVDDNKGGGMNNLLKNGNFINNSTNGYGSTPDDWTSSSANPVQGGFPSMTKQELIDLLGISDGDIEGLWNLNEASGDAIDLSSNGYNLTDTNTVLSSEDGLMGKARDFELDNSEYFTIADASCPNLEISGSQTWFAFIKVESFAGGTNRTVLSKRNGAIKQLYVNGDASPKAQFYLQGLTTAATITSDVVLESGKWYFIVGVYDSTNSLLKIWVNGIKKQTTASGSATDSNGNFQISAYNGANEPYDGLIQNAGVLSVALTDSQVKKLFAATMYRGMKIRRATSDASLTQALPEDLVERLRGKDISIVAKAYQTVASTMQVSINDGTEEASVTNATVDAWQNIGVTKTISATATAITLALKHSTTDGNSWFKEVSVYEGSSLVYVWYPSYDDIARFPRLLAMDFPAVLNGYSFEENRWYSWTPIHTGFSSDPTNNLSRFMHNGNKCSFQYRFGTQGTSNQTYYTFTLPVKSFSATTVYWSGNVLPFDNGANKANGLAYIDPSTTICNVLLSTAAAWTNSGGKNAQVYMDFEID